MGNASYVRYGFPTFITYHQIIPANLDRCVEEHHIANFDPGAFFTLHDYDSSLAWTPSEIRRTYGLDDESARGVPEEKREEVVKGVLAAFDRDGDGIIDRREWLDGWMAGKRLPDFGVRFARSLDFECRAEERRGGRVWERSD